MKKRRVLVDLDNTIVNFNKKFFDLIEKQTGHIINPYDSKTYNFEDYFDELGFSKNIQAEMFHIWDTEEDFYKDIEFLPVAELILKQIEKLKERGFCIVLDSKSGAVYNKTSKEKFIREHLNDKFDEINICSNLNEFKSFDYKIVYEDNPAYIKAYLQMNPSGIVILSPWGYNKELLLRYPTNVFLPDDKNLNRIIF